MGINECIYCHKQINRDVSGRKLSVLQREQAKKYLGQDVLSYDYICNNCRRHPPSAMVLIYSWLRYIFIGCATSAGRGRGEATSVRGACNYKHRTEK
jgi:hypothetical protein